MKSVMQNYVFWKLYKTISESISSNVPDFFNSKSIQRALKRLGHSNTEAVKTLKAFYLANSLKLLSNNPKYIQ